MTKSPRAQAQVDKGRLQVKRTADAPAVILVEPQLAENLGTTARAMMNCALPELRLVDPKVDWLGEKAVAAASGGERILERAARHATVEAALADLEFVYATTARRREMVKPIFTAKGAAADMRAQIAAGRKVGVLFGREAHGLTNAEVALCDAIIEVPLNPEHSSLNLAQAVLVVGYEWFQAAAYDGPQATMAFNRTRPAPKEMLFDLFDHLERELIACGFLRHEDKRQQMVINIRNMLQRAELTEQEIRTLHGIIKELRYGRRPDRPQRQPGTAPEPAPKPLKERMKSSARAD
ncbi:MAG: RNA methyltransferase [Rhodospirillaceae bacterium]|nr:RNA methyltransferase [Rhodospirillaceae bacterium]